MPQSLSGVVRTSHNLVCTAAYAYASHVAGGPRSKSVSGLRMVGSRRRGDNTAGCIRHCADGRRTASAAGGPSVSSSSCLPCGAALPASSLRIPFLLMATPPRPPPPPCHSRCAPCPVRVKHMRRPLPALAREAPGSDGAAHSATRGGGGDDGQHAWRGPRSRRSRIADRGWERPRDGCVLEGGPAG